MDDRRLENRGLDTMSLAPVGPRAKGRPAASRRAIWGARQRPGRKVDLVIWPGTTRTPVMSGLRLQSESRFSRMLQNATGSAQRTLN